MPGSEPVKIAHLVQTFPALSETFILTQITGQLERGHEVDVYAQLRGDVDAAHEDVERYQLLDRTGYTPELPPTYPQQWLSAAKLLACDGWRQPVISGRSLNVLRFRRRALTTSLLHEAAPYLHRGCPAYDVVHAHFGPMGMRALPLKHLGVLNAPLVVTFYGHDVTRYPKRHGGDCYAELFDQADRILALSRHMADRLLALGSPAEKTLVHHLGIDVERFAFQERHLLAGESPRLISVARLVEKKGLEYAIRAVAQVKDRHPQVRYRIVGDGPLRPTLEALIRELGVETQVELAGAMTQRGVVEQMQQAHVFVLPSVAAADGDEEGTPTSIAEASASGLPVLSTVHSGIPEMVREGASGFLVPERDVAALAGRLDELLSHPERWPAMSRAGRAWAEQEFDTQKLNDRLLEIYAGIGVA